MSIPVLPPSFRRPPGHSNHTNQPLQAGRPLTHWPSGHLQPTCKHILLSTVYRTYLIVQSKSNLGIPETGNGRPSRTIQDHSGPSRTIQDHPGTVRTTAQHPTSHHLSAATSPRLISRIGQHRPTLSCPALRVCHSASSACYLSFPPRLVCRIVSTVLCALTSSSMGLVAAQTVQTA